MSTKESADQAHAPAVVITNVWPSIDGGRYPVKRVVGEPVEISADVFKDGHDLLFAVVRWRKVGRSRWEESPMIQGENDRWNGTCTFFTPGMYEYTIQAWPDTFRSWKHEFEAKFNAKQEDLSVESEEGARLLDAAAERAMDAGDGESAAQLKNCANTIRELPVDHVVDLILSDELQTIIDYWPDRGLATAHESIFGVLVEDERARFSAWYEFFPRSAFGVPGKHASFRDCLPRLDDAAEMGFDVVYLPPIHPIGETARKGKNNSVTCEPGDTGSPWAIGSKDGGYRTVHPELGTLEDFEWFISEAKQRGIEIAMDFALNCSPDHPYVRDHPDWFFKRPDGSIKYAENPPKKYQDIYPLNFHCSDWKELWRELTDVVLFWIDRGVRIFRVDNPHTKPVAFWEYLISEVRNQKPDTIFLSEAFTRPKMMKELGKVGFSQSYTYFTWRETKWELTEYLTELTQFEMREYYRGNLWPNTPDILAGHLQNAPPAMFKVRAALAATLSSSWGMYSGYEFCENTPLPGKEEYLDSEKYQIADRDWTKPGIKAFLGRLNKIRKENPAMHRYTNLRFFDAENDQVLCYGKMTANRDNIVVVVISLDVENVQESMINLPTGDFGLDGDTPYIANDLLHGRRYQWSGGRNFVSLDPGGTMMHIFRIEKDEPQAAKDETGSAGKKGVAKS